MPHPIVVVDAAQGLKEIDRLPPVETLKEAKSAVASAGYHVVDSGPGGDCETTSTWHPDETVHLIMVKRELIH